MHWLFEPILQYLHPFSFLHPDDILNSLKQGEKKWRKKGKKEKEKPLRNNKKKCQENEIDNVGIMLFDRSLLI